MSCIKELNFNDRLDGRFVNKLKNDTSIFCTITATDLFYLDKITVMYGNSNVSEITFHAYSNLCKTQKPVIDGDFFGPSVCFVLDGFFHCKHST